MHGIQMCEKVFHHFYNGRLFIEMYHSSSISFHNRQWVLPSMWIWNVAYLILPKKCIVMVIINKNMVCESV